jgi:hypothetical protein
VRLTHDFGPVPPADLVRGNLPAHFIDQDFRTPARQGLQSGPVQACQSLGYGELGLAGEVDNFCRRQGMNLNLGKSPAQLTKEIFKPVDP